MASPRAICRIRIGQPPSLPEKRPQSVVQEEKIQPALNRERLFRRWEKDDDSSSVSENESLLSLKDVPDVSLETRLHWAKTISELFLDRASLDENSGVRDWDLVLNLDRLVVNQASNSSPSSPDKVYPARYRIPEAILERCRSNKEKVKRAEWFALGGILYHVFSGREIFADLGRVGEEEIIQSRFLRGEFPDDVWQLPIALRILGCWCPSFAKDLLAARNADVSYRSKVVAYMKEHPVRFGFQVAGGLATIASIVALPILGAIGFGVAGPAAGSAAAAWQSSIGLVEAGSLFAWCQSAAAGGVAVGGVLATGLTGAGVAVGATISGALDDVDPMQPDLREKFLTAWRKDIGEMEEIIETKLAIETKEAIETTEDIETEKMIEKETIETEESTQTEEVVEKETTGITELIQAQTNADQKWLRKRMTKM